MRSRLAPPAPSSSALPRGAWLARFGMVLTLLAFSTVLACLRPQYLTAANLINLVRQISINGILAVGVTYVLLTGGVDLSLGSVVALTGVIAATFAHPGQYPVAVPVLIGIGAGALCGAAAGLEVPRGRLGTFA